VKVQKAHRLAPGVARLKYDGLESPVKAERKKPPDLVQKRFPRQLGSADAN
jgi:hypothetical protein